MKRSKSKKQSSSTRRRLTPETVMLLRQVFFGFILVTVLGGLITGIWYGTRIEALTINEVTVTGGETISHSAVAAIATETLAGTYFRLVPRQFAWLYPETEIIQNIYALERVQSVTITRVDQTVLQIHIIEYRPAALWCHEADEADCYFVDAAGYAFTHAPHLTGGSFVRYATLGRTPKRGAQLAPLTDLAAITWFYTTLNEELGWAVVEIEIDTAGDVFYTLSDKSELKVSLATDPAEVYTNLVAILNADSFTGLAPGDFQYIDLRFGNKVFVNREPWETAASSTSTSTLAWDELTAEVMGGARSAEDNESLGDAATQALAVPLIEEDNEEVLIEPTPEVPSTATTSNANPTTEADTVATDEAETTSTTSSE